MVYILPIGGLYGTDPTYEGNQETADSPGEVLELANTDLCEGSPDATEMDAEPPEADAELFLGEEF